MFRIKKNIDNIFFNYYCNNCWNQSPQFLKMNRRKLLKLLGLSSAALGINSIYAAKKRKDSVKPIVISTWYNQSTIANKAAWDILKADGNALDAVEAGVQICENDVNNCCVGLGAFPDRDGIVTLDACIMNHNYEIGSVAALERIKSPVHAARMVMEMTPHVMIVGDGAQQFALSQGAALESPELSTNAKNAYDDWLKKSEYKPKINIEKGGPNVPNSGEYNHDTIGMIAIDSKGNLSGACTTSGMAFKMHGRVGDSPIIGAGLYVDNEVGAATATGQGEEVIRSCGSFLVVEFMRKGYSPEDACRMAVDRIKSITPKDINSIQVGFIALNKRGEYGSYALQKGFDYGVTVSRQETFKVDSSYIVKK